MTERRMNPPQRMSPSLRHPRGERVVAGRCRIRVARRLAGFEVRADRVDEVDVCQPHNFISTHGAIGGEAGPLWWVPRRVSGGFLLVASAGEIRGSACAPEPFRSAPLNTLARHTDVRV